MPKLNEGAWVLLGAQPYGYLHIHEEMYPEGIFLRHPLSKRDRVEGWTQLVLYAEVMQPNADSQFGASQKRKP